MALLCDYFLAVDDEQAAETIDWVGGPSRPPEVKGGLFRRAGQRPAPPTLQAPGIEPVVMMATLEGLLRGQPSDELVSGNATRQVAIRDGGERLVFRLSDSLQAALADASEEALGGVATPWSETEEFFGQGDPQRLNQWLTQLAQLARQAQGGGQAMYCWMCV